MTKLVLKVVLGFAVVGYLVAVALDLIGPAWRVSPAIVLTICPANFLPVISMTDPSFGGIVAVIAPLNAILYGVVGLIIGLVVAEVRGRKSERRAV